MTGPDDLRHDPEESPVTAPRYAGFGTADGYVLYDTENASAWIESDTVLDPTELQ